MTNDELSADKPEPPLIERARRVGWVLLALSVLSGGVWRYGGSARWAAALAVVCGLLGLLAIVNVALVRGLYRQLDVNAGEAQDSPATGSGTRKP